jgi:putative transposase
LPHEYPQYNGVFCHYIKLRKNGTLEQTNTICENKFFSVAASSPIQVPQFWTVRVPRRQKRAGERGYDAGKKINGRKRHIVVDTLGNFLHVMVHDGVYKNGGLVDWVRETFQIKLEVVNREPGQKRFQVLPRRWVVERTFAWLGLYRRLSKDYERCPPTSETVVYIASVQIMLRRLAASL